MGRSVRLGFRALRASAAALSVSLFAYGMVALPAQPASAASATADVTSRPDAVSAALTARLEGHRVAISDDETDASMTYANPDDTFTTETTQGPVRVAQPGGGFDPLNLTLTQNSDGSYSPTTAAAPFTLNNGGSATAATLPEASGRSVGLGWTSKLPIPKIQGGTATYAISSTENLVVAATSEGFTADVVLTAPPTASNFTVTLPLSLAKLTASQAANGTVSLQDTAGDTVASAHQFAMWDSSVGPTPLPDQETAVPTKLSTPTSGAPQLVLSPSMSYLDSPTTKYPVTIDPSIGSLARTGSTFWYTSNTSPQAGNYELIVGPNTSGSVVYRSFVNFNANLIMASHVTSANLSLYQIYAASCAAQSTTAYASSAVANASTIWSNAPAKNTSYSDAASFNTAGSGCSPAQSYGSESIPVTNILNAWSNSTIAAKGIQLWATSETNTAAGKIFCSEVVTAGSVCNSSAYEPTLSVTYDDYPQVATGLSAEPSSIGSTGKTYTTTVTPALSATTVDPDGSQVYTEFQVLHDPSYPSEGTGTVWTGYSALNPQGKPAALQVPSGKLVNGYHYEWEAIGYVQNSLGGYDYAPTWSPMQYLAVDTNIPPTPTVACTAFPSGAWTNASPAGATCTASDTVVDLSGFYYSFDNPDPETQVTQSSGSATITMPSGNNTLSNGMHTLYVQAYNIAYSRSTTITQYSFGVGVGGLSSPSNDQTTQQAVVLTTTAAPAETGVTFSYRQGSTGAWITVPTGDVTIPGTNTNPTWPQAVSGTSSALNWNLAQTVHNAGGADGPLQLQACFSHSGIQDGCSSIETLILAQTAFGDSQATTAVGPGTLSLLTGDLDVSATDAAVAGPGDGLALGRDLTTLGPASSDTGATGIFGPAWTADLPSPSDGYASDTLLTAPSIQYATLTGANGVPLSYLTGNTGFPYTYVGIDAANDGSVLKQSSTTSAYITETDGTVTTWTRASSTVAWQLVSVSEYGGNDTISYTYNSAGQVTQVVAPAQPGVNCTSSPLTTIGCRTLSLIYATSTTATGTSPSQWGNFYDATNGVGRLQDVQFTAYNPHYSSIMTLTVAQYAYDNTGMLRGEWNPEISPALETTYSYDANDRLTTITPPGLNGDTINYDSAGRVASVQWTDPVNGTATQAVAYNVPTTGSGAPIDMSAVATDTWGQTNDLPYTATEVFPPDYVPSTGSNGDYAPSSSDYPYGSISYLDVNGYDVDDASYGAGSWQISATQYDGNGNTVWQLTPNDRSQALTPTADTDPLVGAMPSSTARADALATTSVYATNGYDLTDTYSPTRQITLSNGSLAGTVVDAQDHTHYVYNQGAPSGGSYDLVTETDESPYFAQSGSTTPTDYTPNTRTTLTGYNPVDGSSTTGPTSGWTLSEPTTETTVMPGSGNNITTETEYDSNGDVTESIMPKASSSGVDAYTTDTVYYTAGSNTPSSCGLHPEWAGLVCQTGPAAQPTSGPPVPNTVTTYNMYDEPLTVTATSGSVTKTTTDTYDAAGRPVTSGIVDTTSGVLSIPTTTTSYDPSTGLTTSVSSSAGTITTGYNALGEVTSYTVPAASGTNTTTTSYTIDGHVASVNDGKGTTTYTYNGTDSLGHPEHRGLVTSESTGVASGDTFTGAYDADGSLISETYPNGLVATRHYDGTDEATSLAYAMGASTWASFQDGYNDFGQVVSQSSPESSQAIGYDQDARISQVADNGDGTCATRVYGYDADSSRTSYTSYPASATNTCSTTTTPTLAETYSHDQDDRLTNTGYAYDNMGRTTTVPAVDTYDTNSSPTSLAMSYYADDMVHTEAQDGVTDTFTLDPAQRILGETNSTTGVTATSIYGDGSDSPAWISNSTGTWSRNIADLAGNLAETESSPSAAGATLQLVNLHGDVIATAPDSTSDVGYSTYTEDTEFGAPRANAAGVGSQYGWLGGKERSSNALGGVILMGVRVYDPAVGRFLSVDPLPGGSANSYDYCDQDPINNVDLGGAYVINGPASPVHHPKLSPLAKLLLGESNSAAKVKVVHWHGLTVYKVGGIFLPYVKLTKRQAAEVSSGGGSSVLGSIWHFVKKHAMTVAYYVVSCAGRAGQGATAGMGAGGMVGGPDGMVAGGVIGGIGGCIAGAVSDPGTPG
ncbi:MAG TPA: RHS repeat-associated core domain-containing protein [Mycobacteriales bacterium]|jgi:RHS repeat-associated protein|nr:RHS repeat-associated core domain-containing protein [Mycobacteriales bacterium]